MYNKSTRLRSVYFVLRNTQGEDFMIIDENPTLECVSDSTQSKGCYTDCGPVDSCEPDDSCNPER